MKMLPLLVMCLCFSIQRTGASLVSLEAFPKEIVENITQAVAMRCSVSDTAQPGGASPAADIRHISSIFISRGDGDDVASVTAFDPSTALADLGNLEVKGSVSATSGEGFLELTWKYPSKMTMGDYVCTMYAVDTKGHGVVLTSGVTMTSVKPSVLDLINNVNLKVEKLQQTDEQQKAEIAKQQEQIVKQQEQLVKQQEEFQQQNQNITRLQQDNTKLQDRLTLCSQQIAFQARLSLDLTVPSGNNVVYDVAMLNYGNGYDNKTGVFTCTVPGIYVFTAHALSNLVSSDQVFMDMKHNHDKVASLYAGKDDTYDSASMSAVLHMKVGDVVKVVASTLSKLWNTGHYQENSFSGHLVQADGCKP